MANRNERRRKARQRARHQVVRSEASHGDIEVGATLVKTASRIQKAAAESRQLKTKPSDQWDPEKTVQPPLPPEALWTIFETNSIHSGCINAKVADAVGRGWKLEPADPDEEGADDDGKKVVRELDELLEIICPKLTFRQLCEQAARELDAIGWSDWEILRERAGDVTSEIVGILPVPAMSIRAVKDSEDVFCQRRGEKKVYYKRFGVEAQVDCETGNIDGDDVTEGGGVPEEKRANELVHFMHYSPRSSWYGIPPWVSAMPAVAEFQAIREYNVSFFESGGQADRLIHVSGKDDGSAATLADEIVKQVEDARGEAHTTIVTHSDKETEVTIESLEPKKSGTTGSGRESDYRGGKQDLIMETRVAHQVPPGRLGIAEGGAMAGNANDSMDDDYRIGVVEPLQEILEAEIRRTVLGDNGFGPQLAGWKWSFEDRTQDDTQDEHDRLMSEQEHGTKSPNDVREAKGDDRVDDPAMDRYYIDGQPISTDPAVTDVTSILNEIKTALGIAVQKPNPDDQPELDDAPPDDPTPVEASAKRRLWRRVKPAA